ncbi:uncharacterized protein Bfra_010914 [Botrytis fragariae]|uniref:Uncharacterized protein n=1 Tax=Botrytis fragariae TaxID=1964551 RepID=A0A8H6EET4_9HELO|nr:uncharacterized protein Bfra_010914 [Botrytis fragariae]KAF5869714.1 hypothetical protein Bfra_010914 [Botrytis fragariae]
MPTSPESASPESPLSESPPSESLSPESPPPKFILSESPSSKLILPEALLSEFTSSEPLSPESPSSKSLSPRPQSALFVDRGLKVQVWLDTLVEKGGCNSGRGRGPPIFCESLLDIDSPQDWRQMLHNLQRIIDLQFVPLLEASPEIVDVFVVWDGDVPPECDGWSKWSEWLKCKRWNGIGTPLETLNQVFYIVLEHSAVGSMNICGCTLVELSVLNTFPALYHTYSSIFWSWTPHSKQYNPFDGISIISLEFKTVSYSSLESYFTDLTNFFPEMSDQSSSSVQSSMTPGIQIRAMNISDGSPPFLCNTPLGIVPLPDFSAISTTLIQIINTQAFSRNFSCIEGDISIFIHWAGETAEKYAYQTASRCWNNISLDLMLLSEKRFSVDSPDELKDLWSFLAKRRYRDEIFCIFEASPIRSSDLTSESEKDAYRRDRIHSDG